MTSQSLEEKKKPSINEFLRSYGRMRKILDDINEVSALEIILYSLGNREIEEYRLKEEMIPKMKKEGIANPELNYSQLIEKLISEDSIRKSERGGLTYFRLTKEVRENLGFI